MKAFSDLFSDNPSKKEPFNLLSQELPIPLSKIPNEMDRLPQKYQTRQTYNLIVDEDNKEILNLFSVLMKTANNGLPSNLDDITKEALVNSVVENLKILGQKDAKYADQIEKFGLQRTNNEIKNSHFMKQLLNQILVIHTSYYNIFPITDEYLDLMNRKEQTKSSGFFLCACLPMGDKKQKRPDREFQQIDKILRAKRNVQNLRNAMNNRVQYQQNRQNQQIQETGAMNFLSASLNSQNTKFSYNQNSFNKLVAIEKLAAPKEVVEDGDTSRLDCYSFYMMNHLFMTLTPSHISKIERNPYISNAYNYIETAINSVIRTQNRKKQFTQICQKIKQDLSTCRNCFDSENDGQSGVFHQIQSWMIVSIHIYQSIADQYDPYRRRILKLLFTAFANQNLLHPIEILRWLENHRNQIVALNQTETYQDVLAKDQSLMLQIHENRQSFLQGHKIDEMPKLSLSHLSDKNLPRRKTVNLLISGFLSEDMAKKSQWDQLVQYMPDSQIYALQWQSDKIVNLVKFMGKTAKNFFTGGKIKDELDKSFKDNPFVSAFETAKYSGRYLAELVVQLFPCQFINIAGYSLGSELIKAFLERMIEVGCQNRISNIYMMGGVTDAKQLIDIIKSSKYPLSLYNCHTDNDMVLKHLLTLTKPDSVSIGINQVPQCPGHQIQNIDVSDIISGHLAYMTEFDILGKIIDMEKQ